MGKREFQVPNNNKIIYLPLASSYAYIPPLLCIVLLLFLTTVTTFIQ